MRLFLLIVRRDVALAVRQGGASPLAIAFFILIVTLFPLGVGPESATLARVAAGLVWVAALLATMLSLDRLFQADLEDGTLDLLVLAPLPLGATVIAKCTAHWLATGVPLIVAAPILALFLNMDAAGLGTMALAMLLGTPTLSLIGGIGAALTAGLRRGGVLLPLLVLPLTIPVLIFGVGAVDAAILGLTPRPHLLILAAELLGAIVLAPWASAAALRLNYE